MPASPIAELQLGADFGVVLEHGVADVGQHLVLDAFLFQQRHHHLAAGGILGIVQQHLQPRPGEVFDLLDLLRVALGDHQGRCQIADADPAQHRPELLGLVHVRIVRNEQVTRRLQLDLGQQVFRAAEREHGRVPRLLCEQSPPASRWASGRKCRRGSPVRDRTKARGRFRWQPGSRFRRPPPPGLPPEAGSPAAPKLARIRPPPTRPPLPTTGFHVESSGTSAHSP